MRVQVFPLFAIAALAALSQVADARDGCDAGSFFDGNGCRPMFYQRDPLPYDETQHHGWDVRAGSLPSGEQGIFIEPWNGACPPGFAVDPKIKVCVDRR